MHLETQRMISRTISGKDSDVGHESDRYGGHETSLETATEISGEFIAKDEKTSGEKRAEIQEDDRQVKLFWRQGTNVIKEVYSHGSHTRAFAFHTPGFRWHETTENIAGIWYIQIFSRHFKETSSPTIKEMT